MPSVTPTIPTSTRIRCLLHSPNVGAGTISEWATARNVDYREISVHEGERLPELDELDVLVIMGGPMGAYEQDAYPWILDELALLREGIRREVPMLGICLGSQLLAMAMDAPVRRHSHREVGWWPVRVFPAASEQPGMSHLPAVIEPMLWHGDRFAMPDLAIPLASSEGCDNQAFSACNGRVLGLQFHPEFTTTDIERLITVAEPGELDAARWVQPVPRLADEQRAEDVRVWFWQMLDDFVAAAVSGDRAAP
jgi:GMP synthase-like glutamine amidotransferase